MRRVVFVFILLCISIYTKSEELWGSKFQLHQANHKLELIHGFSGKALRTDGYSTWLSTPILAVKQLFGMSGYFALESFPNGIASFMGVQDTVSSRSVALCVDPWGKLFVAIGNENHTYKYTPTSFSIKPFQWIYLACSFHSDSINVYVNKQKETIHLSIPSLSWNQFVLSKGFEEQKNGMFENNHINGIIDEAKLVFDNTLPNITHNISTRPILAIPVSRFEKDYNRPKFHLLPAANWTNETHALFFYHGLYHIFNQKNASNLTLSHINWGHFSSPDLIHWTEYKPALSPNKEYDKFGIWSGCAIINNDVPMLFYTTGGSKLGVGIAVPKNTNDTSLVEWEKYDGNPIISEQPQGYKRTDLRDQCVFKENNVWYMAIGFGIIEEGVEKGALLLYKSKDLHQWSFVHLLYKGNPKVDHSGIFWEMPVFHKMKGKYILLVNKVPSNGEPANALYWTGNFNSTTEAFDPDFIVPKNLEVINRLLSPSITEDTEGRTTAIAIIPDLTTAKAAYKQGWTHLYSIPRVWSLYGENLEQSPHPNLKVLRNKESVIGETTVHPSAPLLLSKDEHQLEAQVEIISNHSQKFGLVLYQNKDNSEYTTIYFNAPTHEMIVDQSHSSLNPNIPHRIEKGNYPLDLSKPLNLHIFIDGSVVELFINNKDAFTTRVFPSKNSSTQFRIFTEDNPIQMKAKVWTLHPAQVVTNF